MEICKDTHGSSQTVATVLACHLFALAYLTAKRTTLGLAENPRAFPKGVGMFKLARKPFGGQRRRPRKGTSHKSLRKEGILLKMSRRVPVLLLSLSLPLS